MSESSPLLFSRVSRVSSIASQRRPNISKSPTVSKVYHLITSSYINVLLLFVPLGLIAGYLEWSPALVFVFNFLSIVPLAGLLAITTEELASKVGQTLGGLLNATFGNAVELIVAIVALNQGQIRIVQASMLGSILSNLLLVLGCCFLAGGYNRDEQKFNMTVASTMSSLLALATVSLLIPAAFEFSAKHDHPAVDPGTSSVLALSRGTSIVLLIIYVLFLFFQLKTHSEYFEAAEGLVEDGDAVEEEEEGLGFTTKEAVSSLIAITVIISFAADYLVDAIDPVVNSSGISKTFIGLIVIPIVGNAAEHVTAVVVALKDKMDLAVGVAIGSSLQIALFVTPALVILGWIIGQPMSLLFDIFETSVMFVSVFITNYLIIDGQSNWLEGVMLLGTYVIIAVAFFLYP